jgi:hypothetical protein
VFRAFNISGIKIEDVAFEKMGRELRDIRKAQVLERLDSFIRDDEAIDGTKMRDEWFPQIRADVFLSHSHADEALALRLAGWASQELQLSVFVDSSVWGNASELLKKIDDKYCWNAASQTYSYETRNLSTSHVHMMLATALAKMIDGAECAWVLNTPNAITSRDAVEATKSPWMYSEIETMHVVRRREPGEHRGKVKIAKAQREAAELPPLIIIHQVSLNQFATLGADDLNDWRRAWEQAGRAGHALDLLYKLAPEQGP